MAGADAAMPTEEADVPNVPPIEIDATAGHETAGTQAFEPAWWEPLIDFIKVIATIIILLAVAYVLILTYFNMEYEKDLKEQEKIRAIKDRLDKMV